MDETNEKLRDVTELPLFPLGVVLYPGAPLPLHIFEPRYRQMLRDALEGNRLFGLSYFEPAEHSLQTEPAVGHIGCAAEITAVQSMPDGRANIMTRGVARYRLNEYTERGASYLTGAVEFFFDEKEDATAAAKTQELAAQTGALFTRVATAARRLNDERGELPKLASDDPEALSFTICAALELENDIKQELLETRSTRERLARIHGFLARVVDSYEDRAHVHKIAKTNGHAKHKIEL